MTVSRVVLKTCIDYELQRVYEALEEAVGLLGGIKSFVSPGDRVLLKPNLVLRKKPEQAATTHPAVVEAAVRLVQEAGGTAVIGDSPGGPYNRARLKGVYNTCGMEAVAETTGALVNYETGEVELDYPQGDLVKQLVLARSVVEADVVINLPKLKAHQLTRFTGAVKNMYGAVPGLKKAEYHFNIRDITDFSRFLLDVALLARPALNIMDAVVGMEGRGPTAGDPRDIGALLVSDDAAALDVAAVSLVGINPEAVPTIRAANRRGMPSSLEEIEVIGDRLEDFNIKNFIVPDIPYTSDLRVPVFLKKYLAEALKPRPVFVEAECIGCGDCAMGCPPKAITISNRIPRVNLKECIGCFCCQELCLQKAVVIKRGLLNKLFHRF